MGYYLDYYFTKNVKKPYNMNTVSNQVIYIYIKDNIISYIYMVFMLFKYIFL